VHLTILYIVDLAKMVATTICIWQPALGGHWQLPRSGLRSISLTC